MLLTERANKNLSSILHRIGKLTGTAVAIALGKDGSYVTRYTDTDKFQEAMAFIAACDMKIVPSEYRCANPEYIQSLETIASQALNKNSGELAWDE